MARALGVNEAKVLDLYDTLLAAGGHHVRRHVGYDELLPPEVAEALALDLSTFHRERCRSRAR